MGIQRGWVHMRKWVHIQPYGVLVRREWILIRWNWIRMQGELSHIQINSHWEREWAFGGNKLSFNERESPFRGSKVTFRRSELSFSGSELLFRGKELPFNGSELLARRSELPFSGKELPLTGKELPRGLQRDVVYLGWPIAPSYSYMSPNAGGRGKSCGVSANE